MGPPARKNPKTRIEVVLPRYEPRPEEISGTPQPKPQAGKTREKRKRQEEVEATTEKTVESEKAEEKAPPRRRSLRSSGLL